MTGSIVVVGERINATRARVGGAIAARDEAYVRREARVQADAGADYVDVNAGRASGNEAEDLAWLVEVVQGEVDQPLCLDSADPAALAAAMGKVERPPLVNSVNGEPARIEGIVPLVAERGASVVALTMEEGRMPETVADRLRIAEKLADAIMSAGVPASRIFFDPCVLAASTSPEQPAAVLETTREILRAWPEAHVICGLSNVSFGLPARKVLNWTFLAMMAACGADAFIVDPTAPAMRSTIAAAGVLTGRDEYGMSYITEFRDGHVVG